LPASFDVEPSTGFDTDKLEVEFRHLGLQEDVATALETNDGRPAKRRKVQEEETDLIIENSGELYALLGCEGAIGLEALSHAIE